VGRSKSGRQFASLTGFLIALVRAVLIISATRCSVSDPAVFALRRSSNMYGVASSYRADTFFTAMSGISCGKPGDFSLATLLAILRPILVATRIPSFIMRWLMRWYVITALGTIDGLMRWDLIAALGAIDGLRTKVVPAALAAPDIVRTTAMETSA